MFSPEEHGEFCLMCGVIFFIFSLFLFLYFVFIPKKIKRMFFMGYTSFNPCNCTSQHWPTDHLKSSPGIF